MTARIPILLALASLCQPAGAQERARVIPSAEEAIRLAESFLREQGYTGVPGDSEKLKAELFGANDQRSPEVVLAERSGTTEAKAYAYLKDDLTGWLQW